MAPTVKISHDSVVREWNGAFGYGSFVYSVIYTTTKSTKKAYFYSHVAAVPLSENSVFNVFYVTLEWLVILVETSSRYAYEVCDTRRIFILQQLHIWDNGV